jgi:hypothetical protein
MSFGGGRSASEYLIRWVIRSTTGRDVSKISANTAEMEVMLLPNAALKIDKVTYESGAPAFKIGYTYVIEATQIGCVSGVTG